MNRSESGQLGFSVLLFQDLAVIPALALVPLLAGSADEHFDWMKIGMKVLAFVGMLIGGRYYCVRYSVLLQLLVCGKCSPPRRCCWCWVPHCLWMRWGCRWRSVRLLRVCYWRKVNIAMNWKRLSILQRLAARFVLYLCRHVTQPRVLYTHLLWVVISVVVLVAVKILVLYLLARLYGVRSSERMQFAGVLSQGGEFAFVLFSSASSQRLFLGDQMALLLVTVTLSMMTTPLLMKLVDKWLSRQFNGPEEDENHGSTMINRRLLSWALGVLVR